MVDRSQPQRAVSSQKAKKALIRTMPKKLALRREQLFLKSEHRGVESDRCKLRCWDWSQAGRWRRIWAWSDPRSQSVKGSSESCQEIKREYGYEDTYKQKMELALSEKGPKRWASSRWQRAVDLRRGRENASPVQDSFPKSWSYLTPWSFAWQYLLL